LNNSVQSNNSNTDQIIKRSQNWTILLDLDGTLGYSLIPQSKAETGVLQRILDLMKSTTQNKHKTINWDQLNQLYRQVKKQIYTEYPALPQRHDKRLRYKRLLDEIDQTERISHPSSFLDNIMAHYWEIFEEKARVFDDTYDSLLNLRKDFLLIILTNNMMNEAVKKLQVFGLEQGIHYDILITAECIGFCKEAIGFFDKLQDYSIQKFNIELNPERLVIVGDELTDVIFGNRAGIHSVRIHQDLLAEKIPMNELEEPNFTINTLSELIPIMKNHLASHQ